MAHTWHVKKFMPTDQLALIGGRMALLGKAQLQRASASMPTYHQKIPPNCPCKQATPRDGKIYRGIKRETVSPRDFLSHAERPKAQCDRGKCQSWGLSVWLNFEDVLYARGASSFLRNNMYIAVGDVKANEGCLLHTPSNEQPQHHTYWKDVKADFVPRFKVVLAPEPQD